MIFLLSTFLLKIAQHQTRRRPNKVRDKSVSIKIDYPGSGNKSEFVYDGLDQNAKIVETANSVVTSTKQFVWCGSERCEQRDGSSALVKQFFQAGQLEITSNDFYVGDHLGSVRTMTDGAGNVKSDRAYNTFGRVTINTESVTPDFGYAGYYFHTSSGLCLTLYRAYNPKIGRWMNQDPIGESGGSNLYEYALNRPTTVFDPSGLKAYSLADFASTIGGKPSDFINGCVDVVNKLLGLPPGSGDPAANGKGKCWLGKYAQGIAEAYAKECKCGGVVWSKQGTLQGNYAPGPVPSSSIGGPPGYGGGFNYVAETNSGMFAYMDQMARMTITGELVTPRPGIHPPEQKGYIDPTPPNFANYPDKIWCARCKGK